MLVSERHSIVKLNVEQENRRWLSTIISEKLNRCWGVKALITCVSSGMRWRPTSKPSMWSAGLCRDAPKTRSDRRFYHWVNRINVSAAARMLDLPEDHRRLQRLLPQVRGSSRLQLCPRLALPFNLCLWPVYLLLSSERCVGISVDDVWTGLTLCFCSSLCLCVPS